ncbi:hypothetical protein J8J40_22670, partial [Mycobacterium tuberculosis]|nr:hypothetical protein [Mycobacterium tuberculosis]
VAVSSGLLASLIAGPFVNILLLHGGWRWLAAYGVIWALAAVAAAAAVVLATGLFRTVGPRRTRTVAQIAAAVVGAAFVIGIQVVSILSYGQFARVSSTAAAVFAAAPEPSAPGAALLYAPARAALGDPAALAAVLMAGGLA